HGRLKPGHPGGHDEVGGGPSSVLDGNSIMKVTLSDIYKSFGPVEVVKGLDLTIADGEFLVLLGPSRCGKTTALRMVAGLESVTSGRILIGDREVTQVLPKYRDV